MKSFSNAISQKEIEQVATFVFNEFVSNKNINTFYHTPENGWYDHKDRYAAAYPFVLGEIEIDAKRDDLNSEQKNGLQLFLKTCITCHDGGKIIEKGDIWDKYPHSQQGCGVVCHKDGRVEFPWTNEPGVAPTGAGPRSPYQAHGIPPKLESPTPSEQLGEDLYQKNCAFCHAMDGTGGNWIGAFLEPHARNLTDPEATAHLDPETLKDRIRDGVPGSSMPAWGSVLKSSEIDAIAAYVQKVFFQAKKAPLASNTNGKVVK